MLIRCRRYLIAGLMVWIPLWVTWVVLRFVVRLMDNTIALLPKAYQPEQLFGFSLPGLGMVLSIAILLLTGLLISNFMGQRLYAFWEIIVNRIPLVRSIYSAVKQILNSILAPEGSAFRQVLLIEYPRQGLWTIAFQTSELCPIVNPHSPDEPLLMVFVPTTPNPTSGFLLLVPKKDAQKLDMSVEDALKLVISLGVVQPDIG